MRYDACVMTGARVRFAANSPRISSVSGFPSHWFEFLAKMAMALALITAARSNAVGSPPLVDVCAPIRSPGASGKAKRVILECGGSPPPSERQGAATYSTEGRAKPPHSPSLQSGIDRHGEIDIDRVPAKRGRSGEHTSELQSQSN